MDFNKEHKRLKELCDLQMDKFILGLVALYFLSMVERNTLLGFILITVMLGSYTLSAALCSCRKSREMKENRRLYEASIPKWVDVNALFNVEITFERI